MRLSEEDQAAAMEIIERQGAANCAREWAAMAAEHRLLAGRKTGDTIYHLDQADTYAEAAREAQLMV